MSFFNFTEEDKLRELISQALRMDVGEKTNEEIIELAQNLAKQSDCLLQYIEKRVQANEQLKSLEQKIKCQDEALEKASDIIRQTKKKLHETEEALAKATTHSENWGGARPGAGRKPTGIKRFSRKVMCSSMLAAAFAEYGRQLGKQSMTSIVKTQELEEKNDIKIRYIYLSKEEWDIVKPIYHMYCQNNYQSIWDVTDELKS